MLAEVAESTRNVYRSVPAMASLALLDKANGPEAVLRSATSAMQQPASWRLPVSPCAADTWSEADVVRAIFNWATNDGLPLTAICEKLNDEGIPTPPRMPGREKRVRLTLNGNKWQTSLLSYILHHSAYRGHNKSVDCPRRPTQNLSHKKCQR